MKQTKLKVGMQVSCRFLSAPCSGVIVAERADGNFDVRIDSGKLLPGINWYDPYKKKPWFIETANGITVDIAKVIPVETKTDTVTSSQPELDKAYEDQKKFLRGKLKK